MINIDGSAPYYECRLEFQFPNYTSLQMSMNLNLVLSLLILIILSSCQKDQDLIVELHETEKVNRSSKRSSNKVSVCHNGSVRLLNENAVAAHLAHGDVLLEDEDGDGFFPDNSCGYGPMGDCDDNDDSVYPGAPEICDDGIDNDCDGYMDMADSDCIPSFMYTSDFDTTNDLGLALNKGCLATTEDYGNGFLAGVNGGVGFSSVGPECNNRGDMVNLLSTAKLSFELSAICDNCNDNAIDAELTIQILNDYGLYDLVTISTDMFNQTWRYREGAAVSTSFDNHQSITSPTSSIEITDIPSGWSAIIVKMNGKYIRGDGDVWALDNLVFQNM